MKIQFEFETELFFLCQPVVIYWPQQHWRNDMNISRRLLHSTIFGVVLAATPVIAGHMAAGPSGVIGWSIANAAPGANNGGNNGGNAGGNGGSNAGGNGVGNANAGGTHSNGNSPATASMGAGNGNQGHSAASTGQLASAMGALNAAHASPAALANAAPGSTVGKISTYDKLMISALAMPSASPTQIAARNAAITGARLQLASTTNKSVTPTVIAKVDQTLGLPATDPSLGTTP